MIRSFTIYLHLNKRLVDGVRYNSKKKIAYKVQDYDGKTCNYLMRRHFIQLGM